MSCRTEDWSDQLCERWQSCHSRGECSEVTESVPHATLGVWQPYWMACYSRYVDKLSWANLKMLIPRWEVTTLGVLSGRGSDYIFLWHREQKGHRPWGRDKHHTEGTEEQGALVTLFTWWSALRKEQSKWLEVRAQQNSARRSAGAHLALCCHSMCIMLVWCTSNVSLHKTAHLLESGFAFFSCFAAFWWHRKRH